jgi:serine/threonine protein kinase
LADALDYAHLQGLVHRDVKPANIILGTQDHVTLTDFGLVKAAASKKITLEGSALGTLKYMSPEQAAGRELDRRSDIYSLGVVVYEMLVGETPFPAKTPYQALYSLMCKPPPSLSRRNPRISLEVDRLVLRALSKAPDNRFDTAGQFSQSMAAITGLGHTAESWRETDPMERERILLLTSQDGREYALYHGAVTLGRDASNDIVIPVRQVSRHHAQIRCDQAGCSVMDMGSTNGTFINGLPIPPGRTQRLGPGDVLGLGPVTLRVTSPGSSALPGSMAPGRVVRS